MKVKFVRVYKNINYLYLKYEVQTINTCNNIKALVIYFFNRKHMFDSSAKFCFGMHLGQHQYSCKRYMYNAKTKDVI